MVTYVTYPTDATAAAANPFATNEQLIKEDVNDEISNLFPTASPLRQVLDTRSMIAPYAQFPVDNFNTILRTSAALSTSVAGSPYGQILQKPEGFASYTSSTLYPRKINGVAEIQGIRIDVSGTDRAVSQYGMTDRYNMEVLKQTEALVNNFEWAFWWGKGTPPQGLDIDSTGGIATVRTTQGLMYWILFSGLERARTGTTPGACTSVTVTAAATTDGNGNDFANTASAANFSLSAAGTWAYDANGASLDSAMVKNNMLEPFYRLTNRTGGMTGFASPKVKDLFAGFAMNINGLINTRTIPADAAMVVDDVDYYRTPYGVMSVNLCPMLAQASTSFTVTNFDGTTAHSTAVDETLVVIHPRYFKIGVLRPIHFIPYGVSGDLESGLIVGEQGLLCLNPSGGTAIINAIP